MILGTTLFVPCTVMALLTVSFPLLTKPRPRRAVWSMAAFVSAIGLNILAGASMLACFMPILILCRIALPLLGGHPQVIVYWGNPVAEFKPLCRAKPLNPIIVLLTLHDRAVCWPLTLCIRVITLVVPLAIQQKGTIGRFSLPTSLSDRVRLAMALFLTSRKPNINRDSFCPFIIAGLPRCRALVVEPWGPPKGPLLPLLRRCIRVVKALWGTHILFCITTWDMGWAKATGTVVTRCRPVDILLLARLLLWAVL